MQRPDFVVIGWREWCSLNDLNVPMIKAKIDTGAKTAAVHARNIQKIPHQKKDVVQFFIHPIQKNTQISICCRSTIHDQRWITSSNGQKEERFIIITSLTLGAYTHRIELSLSDRDPLNFRILLGRSAIHERILIDPKKSYLMGSHKKSEQKKQYC